MTANAQRRKSSMLARAVMLLLPLVALAPAARAAGQLEYYSDYFSFVGEDAQGKVAFALDNNRGRDGERFQAEHFVVLHDEREGWLPVHGSGAYPNPAHLLRDIPDSSDFAFSGAPENGMRIKSGSNGLVLDLEPIPRIVERRKGKARYWLGSAAAKLSWKGRTIPGRVIYEYLYRPGWNRLARKYFGTWHDFHALYLRIEGGGDLYIHREDPAGEQPLHGTLTAFLVLGGHAVELRETSISATRRTQAFGLYRWPVAWQVSFRADGVPYEAELGLVERKTVSNWLIGGFSMGIATGELRHGAQARALYGLAELIL
ncbi:MAG TPA: hypothetical protein VFX09_07065 [Burkholderiales bacterium]|nr:hypothetical protein [Burkholderiales bacterium]